MAEVLSETILRSQLPKLTLSVFRGDPLEFQQWILTFEMLIEDSTPDPSRRLHYLLQYTTDSANMLVAGHALNPTEVSYAAAKGELVKAFADPYVLSRVYLKKIATWKTISNGDTMSLKAFCTFLKKCKGSLSSLKHLQQLNTHLYLQKVVAKLPIPQQNNWRKAVDLLERSGKEISFSELVDFIERETRIARHPIFSAEALLDAGCGKQAAGKLRSVMNKADTPKIQISIYYNY
jgi:hypothetical protein